MDTAPTFPPEHIPAPLTTDYKTHGHHHDAAAPLVSRRWEAATVVGNAAIGVAEMVVGGGSSLAVTTDGLHNAGDAVTYYMQAENIRDTSRSEARKQRSRKIAHYIIAASSLGMGIKAGADLSMGHEAAQHTGAAYIAGASLALNGLLAHRLWRGVRRQRAAGIQGTVYTRDLIKHFVAVDIPSAVLAVAGSLLQKHNVQMEQVAAMASGAVGAYAFRPTAKNLSHHCLNHGAGDAHAHHDHSHSHAPHHAAQPLKPSAKGWWQRLRYRPTHRIRPHSWSVSQLMSE